MSFEIVNKIKYLCFFLKIVDLQLHYKSIFFFFFFCPYCFLPHHFKVTIHLVGGGKIFKVLVEFRLSLFRWGNNMLWTNLLNIKQILSEGLLQFRVLEFSPGLLWGVKKGKNYDNCICPNWEIAWHTIKSFIF